MKKAGALLLVIAGTGALAWLLVAMSQPDLRGPFPKPIAPGYDEV